MVAVAGLVPGAAAAETITLQQAMEAAATGHPAVASAEAKRSAAASQRKEAKSNYGPRLSAEGNLLVWNDEVVFGGLTGDAEVPELPPPTTPYEAIVAGLVTSEPTVVREQVTWDVSVTLAQPISPLWAIYHGVRAAKMAEESAELEIDEARRQYVKEAIVAYFRVLQARASLETAQQSVEQLQGQAERVAALVEAGSVQSGEKLRLDVALAAARQQVLQAEAGLELAQASLAVAVNEDPSVDVDAAGWSTDELPADPGTLESAVADAMSSRPELARLELAAQQAEVGVLAQRADYLPQLSAIAQYQHTEGQGLSGTDNAFVGASLSWTPWLWGARKHRIDQAKSQVVQIGHTAQLTRRQVALQVEKAWRDVNTSVASFEVAQTAIAQAEEAFRVAQAQFEVGQTTATDLLDAQTALTESKNNRNAALYEAWVNQAELTYATGRSLNEFGGRR